MPPFLSISGFKGELKSPPIMILSSESKFSFSSVAIKLLKNVKISLSLFGEYTLMKTYVLSLKGHCQEDFAVLGHSCAKIINLRL